MKGKILNRMRWSWMERGMRPFNCWLLLLLSLLSTWEGVCSQNCSDIQVSPVNTTALKIAWRSIAKDLEEINITITIDQVTRSINSSDEEIIGKLKPGTNYNISIHVEYTNGSFNCNLSTATNPSPVHGLSVVNRTIDSLTIQWTKPNDTRASGYTYRVTVTNNSRIDNTGPGETMFIVTGLDPGVQYKLSVRSVTPENTLSSPQEVTITTNPSPVTGLSVVTRTTNSSTIQWTKPNDTGASDYSYNVTVTTLTNAPIDNRIAEKGKTTFTATGLNPGVQYKLSVRSVTPNDTLSSPVELITTTNPSPVTGLSVVTRTTTSLTIQWTKPNDTGASDYSYNITVTDLTNALIDNGITEKGNTTFTATGLNPGVQYKLSVQSVTPNDTLSSPVELITTTNPSPVTGLSVVTRTTTSLTIQWTKPNDTGASDYSYNITVTDLTNALIDNRITEKGNTTFTATGLNPGVQYKLSVRSVTPNDTLSSPVELITTTNPSPVTGLSVVTRTTTSLTIQWTKPNDTGASDYSYNITVTDLTNALIDNGITEKGKTTFTATGLNPGVQYKLSVQSVTPNDTLSSPVELITTTNPSPVTGLSVVTRTTTSLTIQWTKPNDTGASDYSYNITVTDLTNALIDNGITEKGKTTFTATGLNPGVQYKLSVQSVTPNDTLSSPVELITTTNPSPVTGLSVVTRTTTSLTIQWTKPNDTGASDYSYNITVTDLTNALIDNGITEKGNTTFTATGLNLGVQYKLSVRSLTPNDTLSSPVELITTTNPSPVTGLTVVNRTTNSSTIQWTKPNDIGASDYSYNITVTNLTNDIIDNRITEKGKTTFTATGLNPGDQYKLLVRSVTPENTTSDAVEVKITTIPDTISHFRCAGRTGYTIMVEWNEPKGRFSNFIATASDSDRLLINRTIGKDENALSVANLQPGRKYTIKIATVSGQTYSKPEVKECWTSSEPIIIGAIVGSLLGLILIGVLLFFIFYRARRQRKKPDPGSSSMGVLFPEYKPIPLSDYERYFQKKHADTDIGFAEEYQSLANIGTEQSKEASQLPENRTKNRYTNIFPYDAARVKLSQQPDSSSSNYINASYMPGYNLEKAFIAAQGPLPHTVADFWRMIWEQNSTVIVMLTNCIELNRVKCEQYWPMDNRTSVYGDIAVKIISEEILPEWTIRNLHVEKAGCSQPRTVTQMHFTSWPDHGVPNTTDKLLQFQKFVRDHMIKNQGGLPVVHCSAGVGRTGTFIGLDYLMQRVEKESLVDVYGIVRKMRMNRTCMVQTESQYIFLHQCILDSIQQKDISEPIYENQTDLIYENASAIKAAYNHNH
ncbi:receptor-type tyrosine-protein phosphatase H-like isoform X2 [Mobula birostris]|uniref:receptor-type tyrosine-protein phosphatase H-like isoform X2 n=1 Tax=Mobula birostris TaxID=1983395 RepID=UPI003B28A9CB